MSNSQRSSFSTTSRRDFLKTSAVGVAAASGLSLARSAHAAEFVQLGIKSGVDDATIPHQGGRLGE